MKKLTKKLELQKNIKFSWWEKNNYLFSNLRRKNVITENENNYFRFDFKKPTNLGKFYLLSKIHKGLCKVPGHQSSPIVEALLKKFQNSWITIYSL